MTQTLVVKTLAAIAASVLLVAGAFAQSTVVDVANEPAPNLTLLPPLPGPLAQKVVFIPYRLENLRITAVGGAAVRHVAVKGKDYIFHSYQKR